MGFLLGFRVNLLYWSIDFRPTYGMMLLVSARQILICLRFSFSLLDQLFDQRYPFSETVQSYMFLLVADIELMMFNNFDLYVSETFGVAVVKIRKSAITCYQS